MNWINQNAPIKSGTKGRQFWRFSTLKEAYDVYKNNLILAGLPQRSFAFFCNFGYRFGVKKLRLDRYICPKCAEEDMDNHLYFLKNIKNLWSLKQVGIINFFQS
jgi:hypothetical protein